jgi:hypothetical protein
MMIIAKSKPKLRGETREPNFARPLGIDATPRRTLSTVVLQLYSSNTNGKMRGPEGEERFIAQRTRDEAEVLSAQADPWQ